METKLCPNVVLVEDDEDIRETIKEVLSGEGYSVETFCNGKEAIDGLSDHPTPLLILLDIMMPVMNGWEFLKARKTLNGTMGAVPVYIVSANADPDAVKNSDAQGFLRKPLDLDKLLCVVRDCCGEPSKAA